MSQSGDALTIMFADVAGSTRLYEQLGDQAARLAISECLEVMTGLVEQHGGRVIKTIGDELMCCFPSIASGVDAAGAIQKQVGARQFGGVQLAVRIGAQHGTVIQENGDVFGDAVNVAARMAGVARGGQIMITGDCLAGLSGTVRERVRHVDQAPVKGKAELIDIYEVLGDDDEDGATHIMAAIDPTAMTGEHAAAGLLLKCADLSLNLASQGQAVIGRSSACDLVVQTETASRQHARIDYRRGKFVLTDQSTNGTFVRFQDGQTLFLKREESPLWGGGVISLGQDAGDDDSVLIHFQVS